MTLRFRSAMSWVRVQKAVSGVIVGLMLFGLVMPVFQAQAEESAVPAITETSNDSNSIDTENKPAENTPVENSQNQDNENHEPSALPDSPDEAPNGQDNPKKTPDSQQLNALTSVSQGNGVQFNIPAQPQASVDQSSGSLTYSYRIPLPEGRNGMTPDVSLNYSSQNLSQMDSIVGLGWNLSIPYIKREPLRGTNNLYTKAYFSSTFSGNLVTNADTSISQFADYYAESDNGDFLKYTYASNNTWTMTDKMGTVTSFGFTAGARQDDSTDTSKVYKWMVSKITDVNGNEIQFSYTKDQGQIYPSQISYTVHPSTGAIHVIDFTYSTPSSYGTTVYGSAFPVTTAKLLSSIKVSTTVNANTVYYLYSFSHSDAQFIKQKLLTQIDRSRLTTTLDTMTFSYSSKTAGWEQTGYSLASTFPDYTVPGQHVRIADFDQNGYSDVLVSTIQNNTVTNYLNTNNGSSFTNSTSSWSVPSHLISQKAAVVDINGDHYPDLHPRNRTQISELPVYINTGSAFSSNTSGTWDIATYVPEALDCGPNVGDNKSFDTNTFLYDINFDGKNDIIYFGGTSNFRIYVNNGAGFTSSGAYTFTPAVGTSYTISTVCTGDINNDNYQTLVDINGDGLKDYYNQQRGVFLNTGTGFAYSTLYSIDIPTGSALMDRAGFSDINGDNMLDYVSTVRDGSGSYCVRVYINNGKGFTMVNPSSYWPCNTTATWSPSTLSLDDTDKAKFGTLIDVTADGLVDTVGANTTTPQGKVRAISDGKSTWVGNPPAGWGPVVTPSYGNYFDINSDIIVDFISPITNWTGAQSSKVYMGKTAIPNRLTQINGTLGAQSLIEYTTAPTDADDTNTAPTPVVSKVTVQNLGYGQPSMVTRYEYEGGHYTTDTTTGQKRFAGFKKVRALESGTDLSTQRITETSFHQGNSSDTVNGEYDDHISKIGKAFRIETKDGAGNAYSKVVNKWDKSQIFTGRQFVKLAQTTTLAYDGDSTHKDMASSYTFSNTTGNLTQKVDWGEVTAAADGSFTDTGTDKYTTDYTYATGGSHSVTGAPSTESTVNQSSTKVRETRHYYDTLALGSVGKGNETKTENWKSSTNYVNRQRTFNSYGLVTQETNERGKNTTYTYDSLNLFPATVTNHLNQLEQYTYDYIFGKVKYFTDVNSRLFQTSYDNYGRVSVETIPDISNPSIQLDKNLYTYTKLAIGETVLQTKKLSDSNYVYIYTYTDGLGRDIQARVEAEGTDIYSVSDKLYDALGRLQKESLPYFSTGSANTTATTTTALYNTLSYDPENRVTTAVNAAGTVTNSYDVWKTTIVDARGKTKRLFKDAFGNLVKVEEVNGASTYTTLYEYDGNNKLTKITDALGNIRNFTYDGLGRRLTAQDLHASADVTFGTWTYTYDDAGNLTTVQDPKSQTINYTYDDLNRKATEDYTGQAGTEITYTYDSGTNGIGRLTSVTSSNGVNTSYQYNPRGMVKQETKTIQSVNYTSSYTNDYQGNPETIVNPDSSEVKYNYNSAAQLESIQRKESTDGSYINVVSNYDYGPHGKVLTQTNANGTTTTNSYDSAKLYRLSRIQTSALTAPTVVNFNPAAGDGSVYKDASSWVGSHDAASGTAAQGTATTVSVGSGKVTSTNFRIERGFVPFDTASLPDNATITSAKLKVYVESKMDSIDDGTDWITVVQTNQASTTALGTADFDNAGAISAPTEGVDSSGRKDITGISTGQYLEFTLNATGRGWVSKTGTSMFGLREGHDATPDPLNATNGQHDKITFRTSEYTGTSSDPVLEVTYVLPNTAQDINYTYDNNGNITKIIDASSTSASKTVDYTYDDLNRLSSAVASGVAVGQTTYNHSFTYDAIGNILTRTDAAGSYNYAGSTGSNYANPHAVTSIGSVNYTYDNNGNMLTETSGLANTWDYNNRLTQAVKGGVTSTYSYDHIGQRAKSSNGSTTTIYPSRFYNLEGSTQVKHITTPDGQTVATVKGTGASASVFTVHTDHLTGSNVVTTSGGVQEELMDFFPYGNIRLDQKAGSFNEQRKFTGQEYDVDTGLYNYGARYYNPAIGRFASQDPAFLNLTHLELQLVDPQSWNSYAYARNNPLAFMDPDGNMWTPWQSSGSFGNWVGNGAYLHNMFGGNADRISVQVNDIRANGFNSQNVGAIAKETGGIALKTGAVIGGSLAVGAGAGLAVTALTPTAVTTAGTATTACASGGCQKAQQAVNQGINLTSNGMLHAQKFHSLDSTLVNTATMNKSYFNDFSQVQGLVQKAGSVQPVEQFGKLYRVVNSAQNIGVDRASRQATNTYTVITDRANNLINTFPGIANNLLRR